MLVGAYVGLAISFGAACAAYVVLISLWLGEGLTWRRQRPRRAALPRAVVVLCVLALQAGGCLCDDADVVADDQPAAPPCELGLLNAALRSELTVPNVEPFCESVGEGDACAVLCNVHGRGLICDADGCEEHERP